MEDEEKIKKVKEVYDKVADAYSKYWDNDWSDKEIIDKFISLLKSNSKILDIGCGTGYITNYLKENNLSPIGIDISKEMLKVAKSNYPSVHFKECSASDIDVEFNENEFDGIMAFYVLFYIPKVELQKVLVKIKKILKPNAPLILVIREGNGENFVKVPLLDSDEKILFCNLYNEKEMYGLLNQNQFHIEYLVIRENDNPKEITNGRTFIFIVENKK